MSVFKVELTEEEIKHYLKKWFDTHTKFFVRKVDLDVGMEPQGWGPSERMVPKLRKAVMYIDDTKELFDETL